MSSFADIIRKGQKQTQQTVSSDLSPKPSPIGQQQHHAHKVYLGYKRRHHDSEGSEEDNFGFSGPSDQWGENIREHHNKIHPQDNVKQNSNQSLAARVSAISTPSSSTKSHASNLSISVNITPIPAPIMSEEESRNISARNTVALQSILSCISSFFPTMLVLCGIPGCGKSTFASRLIASIPEKYRAYWVVLNQDALGDRKTVIRYTEHALNYHQNTIIDRCNFNEEQRHPWIKMARDHNIPTIVAFELPDRNNVSVCADRAYKRGNSDGVHPGNPDWDTVCARMNGSYTDPSVNEGFTSVYRCRDGNDVTAFIDQIVHAYESIALPHANLEQNQQTAASVALPETTPIADSQSEAVL